MVIKAKEAVGSISVAQILLFIADVPLLVGHIAREASVIIAGATGSVPVCHMPGICRERIEFIAVTLAVLPVLAISRFAVFRLKISWIL